HFFGEAAILGEIGAAYRHLDWCRRTEIHDLAHDVAGLEREVGAGKALWQLCAQALLQISDVDVCAGPERHAHVRFLWATTPKKNRVDWVAGRLCSHVAESNVYVSWARHLLNSIQHRKRHSLGVSRSRPSRRSQPELELVGIGGRKQFTTKKRPEKRDQQHGDGCIANDERSLPGKQPSQAAFILLSKVLKAT